MLKNYKKLLFVLAIFMGANAIGLVSANAQTPEAMLKAFYKMRAVAWKTNKDPILGAKNRKTIDKYLDKTLADYFWKDMTTHKEEVGVLDFDPFYNTQDAMISHLVVGKGKVSGHKATVVVTFKNSGRKEVLTYSLVKQNSVWKISDIKYEDGLTLLGYFKEDEKNSKPSN